MRQLPFAGKLLAAAVACAYAATSTAVDGLLTKLSTSICGGAFCCLSLLLSGLATKSVASAQAS